MIGGAAILAGVVATVHAIAGELAPDSPRAASIAAWLTALYYPLVYWTLRGMEVGLVTPDPRCVGAARAPAPGPLSERATWPRWRRRCAPAS